MNHNKACAHPLWTLFYSMLSISAFTFGGGFVIVTLMKRRFVDALGWLDEEEMLDMTALAQSAPGAIAVNAAILVGRKIAGWPGMAAAVLGTIVPPMVILSAISFFYVQFAANPVVAALLAGMQAGVAAVITDVVLNLGSGVVQERNPLSVAVMVAAFAAAYVLKVNVIVVILCAAALGTAMALFGKREERA